MRRKNTESIGNLIHQVLRLEGYETPLNEWRLTQAWREVMPEEITLYTEALYVKSQALYVKVNSAPLRLNLTFQRKSLVQKLNNFVQAQVITDVIFL